MSNLQHQKVRSGRRWKADGVRNEGRLNHFQFRSKGRMKNCLRVGRVTAIRYQWGKTTFIWGLRSLLSLLHLQHTRWNEVYALKGYTFCQMLDKSRKKEVFLAILAVFQTLKLKIATHPKDILKVYFIGLEYRFQGFSDFLTQLKSTIPKKILT